MTHYVADTNVPVVANGKSGQASDECVLACIQQLETVYANGKIVLDNLGLILAEYRNHLSLSGQPGAGDYFMKWASDVQANELFCEQVIITPMEHDSSDFDEFPPDPALQNFDRSDRKFVAVALASANKPTILNAVDSDWSQYHGALALHGVEIKFLCGHSARPQA